MILDLFFLTNSNSSSLSKSVLVALYDYKEMIVYKDIATAIYMFHYSNVYIDVCLYIYRGDENGA